MKLASIALIAAISICQTAFARFSVSFTFDELLMMSDLVVLMEHEATKASGVTDSQGGIGRITTAKILTKLKGEAKSDRITIHHFFYEDGPNVPNHVTFLREDAGTCSFRTAGRTLFINPARQYLAFLKKQDDGSYIPVTPQYDSNLSFVPLGGSLNRLWMSPNGSGVTAQEEKPFAIRLFVEKEPSK